MTWQEFTGKVRFLDDSDIPGVLRKALSITHFGGSLTQDLLEPETFASNKIIPAFTDRLSETFSTEGRYYTEMELDEMSDSELEVMYENLTGRPYSGANLREEMKFLLMTLIGSIYE